MPAAEADPDPLQFTLGGDTLADEPEEWEETFTVLQHVPPSALAHLAAGATITSEGDVAWNSVAIVRFLRACIVPNDEARWDALMADKRRPCSIDGLAQVMFYVTGAKAERPTGPRPGSPAGSAATNVGSVNGSHGKGDKSKRSAAKRS